MWNKINLQQLNKSVAAIYWDLHRETAPGRTHYCQYRVRQRGCSLTHSAHTPPAVHQGITIWVDEIEFEKK